MERPLPKTWFVTYYLGRPQETTRGPVTPVCDRVLQGREPRSTTCYFTIARLSSKTDVTASTFSRHWGPSTDKVAHNSVLEYPSNQWWHVLEAFREVQQEWDYFSFHVSGDIRWYGSSNAANVPQCSDLVLYCSLSAVGLCFPAYDRLLTGRKPPYPARRT